MTSIFHHIFFHIPIVFLARLVQGSTLVESVFTQYDFWPMIQGQLAYQIIIMDAVTAIVRNVIGRLQKRLFRLTRSHLFFDIQNALRIICYFIMIVILIKTTWNSVNPVTRWRSCGCLQGRPLHSGRRAVPRVWTKHHWSNRLDFPWSRKTWSNHNSYIFSMRPIDAAKFLKNSHRTSFES